MPSLKLLLGMIVQSGCYIPWGWYPNTYGRSGGKSASYTHGPVSSIHLLHSRYSTYLQKPKSQVYIRQPSQIESIKKHTKQDNNPQNTSKSSKTGTTDSSVPHSQDSCQYIVPKRDTPPIRAIEVGWSYTYPKSITQNQRRRKQKDETYQTYKNATVVITIDTDQTATANICNLRFLGILAGTKLNGNK